MSYYELFDYDMTDKDTMILDREDDRLFRIDTGNAMDSIYFTAPYDDDMEEVYERARTKMVLRFGARGAGMVKSIENVTGLLG